jgi:N-acyl-D-aspartate/D-glutamate deacylase
MGRRSVLALLPALAVLASCSPKQPEEPLDLLVRGGTLVDGTGSAPRRADVGIAGDRIVRIGSLDGTSAKRTIDASGLVVAPGFVDLHSHADLILLADRSTQERLLRAKLLQGVTTIVVGNCGLGVGPASSEAAQILAAVNGWMTPEGVHAGPLDTRSYLARLEAQGVLLNVATLVPHGPVRISAMGLRPGRPTDAELARMIRAVEASLDAGAFGLSVGLIYPPGMYSATDELVALAKPVAERDRVFTAHVRGSSETLLDATRELIEIARRTGARVHHSHLEAVGERFWPRIPAVLALEDEARAAGLHVSHDVFPYTRAATMMSAIFPPWALDGGIDALLGRLRDPGTRERIRHDVAEQVPLWPPWIDEGWPHNLVEAVGWDGIFVASVPEGGETTLVGRSIESIARDRNRPPFDVVADLMLASHGTVGQQVAEISGTDGDPGALLTILAHPAAAVISDAEDYGRGAPHPAHAGAFARTLRLARERGAPPLEEIVRKMTGYPAQILRLPDRGTLREGAVADLVVFDPRTVADRATWTEPRLPPDGIPFVILGGCVVVDDGRYLSCAGGRVLRPERRSS